MKSAFQHLPYWSRWHIPPINIILIPLWEKSNCHFISWKEHLPLSLSKSHYQTSSMVTRCCAQTTLIAKFLFSQSLSQKKKVGVEVWLSNRAVTWGLSTWCGPSTAQQIGPERKSKRQCAGNKCSMKTRHELYGFYWPRRKRYAATLPPLSP